MLCSPPDNKLLIMNIYMEYLSPESMLQIKRNNCNSIQSSNLEFILELILYSDDLKSCRKWNGSFLQDISYFEPSNISFEK